MNRLPVLICLIILAGFSQPVLAADVADPAADLVEAGPQLYTWAGPYGCAFVGYSRADFDNPGGGTFRADGFIGGIYAGYNLQSERLVYGLEADVGASDVDGTGTAFSTGVPLDESSTAFGSLRARVGIAYDPILMFATAGLAVASNELSLSGSSDSATHLGWTVGAGVEAALRDNVTSRIEYRYTDFQSRDYDIGNVTISSGYDEHSIRAGLALKF